MKKVLIFLITALLVVKGYKLLPFTQKAQQTQQIQEKVKMDEKEKEARQQIIEKELKATGDILAFKGTYEYKDTVSKKGIFDITLRKTSLDLFYNFGIGIDLSTVNISVIDKDSVVIDIPRKKLRLQYVELDINNSTVKDGNNLIFASKYNSKDTSEMFKEAQAAVTQKIVRNDDYFNKASQSTQQVIKKTVNKLGYKDVILEES